MTGLSASGNYLFVSSRNQNRAYRYTMPSIAGRNNYNQFSGYSSTRDIAWCPDSTVWVSSDWTSVTLRCYNKSGAWVDYIDASLIAHARGVAIDTDGYLWVSDMEADKIYKVDLSAGIGSSESPNSVSLSISSNPFNAFVVITGEGFSSNAQLEIYDIRGRLVFHDVFNESTSWNGVSFEGTPVPPGTYYAFVTDEDENTGTVELLRL